MKLKRLKAEIACFKLARMQYAHTLQEELQKGENANKTSAASSGNGKDKTQAELENKKGLKVSSAKKKRLISNAAA